MATLEQEVKWFLTLSKAKRAELLAWLAHNLTIGARGFYVPQQPGLSDAERCRQLNEILHRVTSYLGHVLKGDEDTGWAPPVLKMVLEPEDEEVRLQTTQAWDYAKGSVNAA